MKTKGAEKHLWTPIPPGPNRSPIQFTSPEGDKGRIWVSDRKDRGGEDVYWRSAVTEAKKEAALARKENEANRSRFDNPVDLVNGRLRRNVLGALKLGVWHGILCVGCCWVLMTLMFVGGVMNVLWMAPIALLVLVEKTVSGHFVSRAVGIGLIVGGWLLMLPTSAVGHLPTYAAALTRF